MDIISKQAIVTPIEIQRLDSSVFSNYQCKEVSSSNQEYLAILELQTHIHWLLLQDFNVCTNRTNFGLKFFLKHKYINSLEEYLGWTNVIEETMSFLVGRWGEQSQWTPLRWYKLTIEIKLKVSVIPCAFKFEKDSPNSHSISSNEDWKSSWGIRWNLRKQESDRNSDFRDGYNDTKQRYMLIQADCCTSLKS